MTKKFLNDKNRSTVITNREHMIDFVRGTIITAVIVTHFKRNLSQQNRKKFLC